MLTQFILEIDWTNDGTWVTETDRLLEARLQTGFSPEISAPFQFTAAPGRLALTLDNSTRRYSPENALSPLYGNLLPRRPVRLTAQYKTDQWVIFRGFLEAIQPAESGRAILLATDALTLLDEARVSLPLQTDQRADELIAMLVAAVYTPPDTDYHAGSERFEVAADHWNADHTSALEAIRECAASEFGRFFIQRDGTAVFLDRNWFFAPPDPILTLDDDPILVETTQDTTQIFNIINVVAHPRDFVGDVSVLARLNHHLIIPPIGASGPGVRRVRLRFRDAATGQFIGGRELVALEPFTDYRINEQPDDSGVDYTDSSYVSVAVVETHATHIVVEFSNSALGRLFVNLLQVRGRPITSYDPLTVTEQDTASQAMYQKRTLTQNLPLPTDSTLPEALAVYLLDRYHAPFVRPLRLTVSNFDEVDGESPFAPALLDTIRVSDAESGLDGALCWVVGQTAHITPRAFTVSHLLERADDRVYFLLDVTGHAELGTTTRLAV
jgi:hypothetical protein